MSHPRRLIVLSLFLLVLGLLPLQAAAQERYTHTYMAGLMVGLGGSGDTLDGTVSDPGFDNFSWQAIFAMDVEKDVRWGARLGQIVLEGGDGSGNDLTYLSLVGEYLYPGPSYQSGLYLGIGYYDFGGGYASDSAPGVNVGVTAGYKLSERMLLLLDLSGHYADLDAVQFFATAHAGIAYRF